MKTSQREALNKLADELVNERRYLHVGDEALQDTIAFEPIILPVEQDQLPGFDEAA